MRKGAGGGCAGAGQEIASSVDSLLRGSLESGEEGAASLAAVLQRATTGGREYTELGRSRA